MTERLQVLENARKSNVFVDAGRAVLSVDVRLRFRQIYNRRVHGRRFPDGQAGRNVGRGTERSRRGDFGHVRCPEKTDEHTEELGWFGAPVFVRRL